MNCEALKAFVADELKSVDGHCDLSPNVCDVHHHVAYEGRIVTPLPQVRPGGEQGVLLTRELAYWARGRFNLVPKISAARRSDSTTNAAYSRSVVEPPPPWPSRPATVRRSTPAVSSAVAE